MFQWLFRGSSQVDSTAEAAPQCSDVKADSTPALPDGVCAFACRNERAHFVVPSKENFFAGIKYEKVLIDSGCNSLLMPFPEDVNVLTALATEQHSWQLTYGRGWLNTTMLTITNPETNRVGEMRLGGPLSPVVTLPFLRFHVTPAAATALLAWNEGTHKFGKDEVWRLGLVEKNGDPSYRSHVLVGQAILGEFTTIQSGKSVMLLCRPDMDWSKVAAAIEEVSKLATAMMATDPHCFNSIEDEDHEGSDEARWEDEGDEGEEGDEEEAEEEEGDWRKKQRRNKR